MRSALASVSARTAATVLSLHPASFAIARSLLAASSSSAAAISLPLSCALAGIVQDPDSGSRILSTSWHTHRWRTPGPVPTS